MPLQPVEEQKQQSQPTEVQPPPQQPEAERKHAGHLRVQVIEESKQGAFMTAQVADPVQRREQMAVALRRSKRMLVLSKKRWDRAIGQIQRMEEQCSGVGSTHISDDQYSEMASGHFYEQLDPFAIPPITDLDHCFDF